MTYAEEFNYTDNHISVNKNENGDTTVTLYKKKDIIGKTNLTIPNIDFGDCYELVKQAYNITGNLITAIVDKKVFSKIKNNPDYHPQKLTALCLCVGAKLNMDETRDLLARAGYALSPCDKTDVIFAYFIENEIYDMIELDIQLEEHGQPCIIS